MADKLKRSSYNFKSEIPDELVMYGNILYKNTIAIKKSHSALADEILSNRDMQANPDLFSLFKRAGFLLDTDFDENAYLRYKYFKHLFGSGVLNLILLPTLSCNFGCVYCRQREQKIFYDSTLNKKIVDFVRKSIVRYNTLFIGWFGGEPLLCKKDMYELTEAFQRICGDVKRKYEASLCTNGSLLDKDFIQNIERLSITSLQITIDGPPEYHNRLRPFANGKPSFEVLRENVELISALNPKVKLSIRINVSDESYEHALQLLDLFSDRTRKKAIIYFRYIYSTKAKDYHVFVENKDPERYWNLCEGALEKGWNTEPPEIYKMNGADQFYYCNEADRIDSFQVPPDGRFYRCSESFFPLGQDAVAELGPTGNLTFSAFENYIKFNMATPFDDEECKSCPYLPLHFGGCRLSRYRGKKACNKANMAQEIVRMLRFIYLYKKYRYRFSLNGMNYKVVNLYPNKELRFHA